MAKRSGDATSFEAIEDLDILTVQFTRGKKCYRVHNTSHPPLWFGPAAKQPPSGRFDAPRHQYRICYFGRSIEASFAETLLRSPSHRLLSAADLAERSISVGEPTRNLRLVRLHGAGLQRIGISTDTISGSYTTCRSLALALWKHSKEFDGFEYRSRFDNDQLCIALFERAKEGVKIITTTGLMDDPTLLGGLLDRYGVGLTS